MNSKLMELSMIEGQLQGGPCADAKAGGEKG